MAPPAADARDVVSPAVGVQGTWSRWPRTRGEMAPPAADARGYGPAGHGRAGDVIPLAPLAAVARGDGPVGRGRARMSGRWSWRPWTRRGLVPLAAHTRGDGPAGRARVERRPFGRRSSRLWMCGGRGSAGPVISVVNVRGTWSCWPRWPRARGPRWSRTRGETAVRSEVIVDHIRTVGVLLGHVHPEEEIRVAACCVSLSTTATCFR